MIHNLIFSISQQLPARFSYCRKCDDSISFYEWCFGLICGSCRAQWLERSKGCQPGEECIECHQARVGIERTFDKEYSGRCFGCLFKPLYYRRKLDKNVW